MKINTVIFDFDGTIADTLAVIIDIVNEHASEFGFKPLTAKQQEELRGKTLWQIIKDFKLPLIKLPSFIVMAQKELHARIDEISLYEGMNDVIEELHKRKYRLGILSSNSKENVTKFLDAHNLLNLFEFVHSELNPFGKAPILKHLISTYKLDKKTTAYVGDEVRDIEASHKVGVDVIAVTWGFNSKKMLQSYKPTTLVDHPKDILKLLNVRLID